MASSALPRQRPLQVHVAGMHIPLKYAMPKATLK